jgi:hypothetical protein
MAGHKGSLRVTLKGGEVSKAISKLIVSPGRYSKYLYTLSSKIAESLYFRWEEDMNDNDCCYIKTDRINPRIP